MLDLSVFDAFAPKAAAVVARVARSPNQRATDRNARKIVSDQILTIPVARVARVARQNNNTWNDEDWQFAFEERAAILEFDGEFPRPVAERLAREQVVGPWHPQFATGEAR